MAFSGLLACEWRFFYALFWRRIFDGLDQSFCDKELSHEYPRLHAKGKEKPPQGKETPNILFCQRIIQKDYWFFKGQVSSSSINRFKLDANQNSS